MSLWPRRLRTAAAGRVAGTPDPVHRHRPRGYAVGVARVPDARPTTWGQARRAARITVILAELRRAHGSSLRMRMPWSALPDAPKRIVDSGGAPVTVAFDDDAARSIVSAHNALPGALAAIERVNNHLHRWPHAEDCAGANWQLPCRCGLRARRDVLLAAMKDALERDLTPADPPRTRVDHRPVRTGDRYNASWPP